MGGTSAGGVVGCEGARSSCCQSQMRPLLVPTASMEQASNGAIPDLSSSARSSTLQRGDQAAAVQLSSPKRRSYAAPEMRCMPRRIYIEYCGSAEQLSMALRCVGAGISARQLVTSVESAKTGRGLFWKGFYVHTFSIKGSWRRFVAVWVLASPGRPAILFCLHRAQLPSLTLLHCFDL